MAVSPLSVSVGEKWHSQWTHPSEAVARQKTKGLAGLRPLDRVLGDDHPLVDELSLAADRAESLSLRQWMAVSGAAVDPGQGRTTKMSTAFLMGLANLRTGYWWDSGISEAARGGFPEVTFIRRVLYLLPRFFATQGLLLFEWLARYPGPLAKILAHQ